jgi:cytochrome c-type biogenesis protein CcmE
MTRSSRPRRGWIARAIALVAVIGAIAYLVWGGGGLGDNLVYFLTPTELLAKGPSAQGSSLRVGGLIEPGTVHWDSAHRELHFRLQDAKHAINVVSVGLPPEMFTEGIGAVVEGVYAHDGVFRSHNLMVKHSNEYQAPAPGTRPAAYYRALFKKQGS